MVGNLQRRSVTIWCKAAVLHVAVTLYLISQLYTPINLKKTERIFLKGANILIKILALQDIFSNFPNRSNLQKKKKKTLTFLYQYLLIRVLFIWIIKINLSCTQFKNFSLKYI